MFRYLSSQYVAHTARHEDGANVMFVPTTSPSPLEFLRGGGG